MLRSREKVILSAGVCAWWIYAKGWRWRYNCGRWKLSRKSHGWESCNKYKTNMLARSLELQLSSHSSGVFCLALSTLIIHKIVSLTRSSDVRRRKNCPPAKIPDADLTKKFILTNSCYSTHISDLVGAKKQCNFATYLYFFRNTFTLAPVGCTMFKIGGISGDMVFSFNFSFLNGWTVKWILIGDKLYLFWCWLRIWFCWRYRTMMSLPFRLFIYYLLTLSMQYYFRLPKNILVRH